MEKSKVMNENYIMLQGWMVNNLKLTGNELIIYALIYGFSQVEGHSFNGSLQYIADWCNISKNSCINNLKKLIDKKLIIKNEKEINNIKFCEYKTNLDTIQKTWIPIQETWTNNIDNNIDINNINIINKEKNENTSFDNINSEITNKQKQKRKSKKVQEAILIDEMLDNYTTNEEVKDYLKDYLKIRRKKGLTSQQWKIILDDLRKECKTDKNYAIEKIKKAIAGNWMQIIYTESFKGKAKTSYSIKPTFDNTRNHNVPKGISNMTSDELTNFDNELARDENGNLLKF